MSLVEQEPAGTPEESGPGGLSRLRLVLAYDGTAFHGWARQPGLRTVQAELEAAVGTCLRIGPEFPVRVAVAGRTDAGVHARAQSCHCDVPADAWARAGGPAALLRRVNGALPADLRVAVLDEAPLGFDARWSAAWRRYEYLVADLPRAADPRTRGHVLWHPRPLDVGAMDEAAAALGGEHDFAPFCRARPGASTVRTVMSAGWARDEQRGGLAVFTVQADAFCHSMVRALVGSLLAVGEGRWPADRVAQLLADGQRVSAIPTAPAHGLTLVEVGYPPDAQLAGQARRARRWRGPQDQRPVTPSPPGPEAPEPGAPDPASESGSAQR